MNTIPIFYACDDNFVKYTIVSLQSMIRNASTDHRYHVYVLHTNIAPETQNQLFQLKNDNFDISFENVTGYLDSISHRLPIRDYYSKTTYFRLFIADMFPQYDKAIYIDSDTVVQGDISRMYLTDIGDAYVGACHEQAMVQVDEYGTYAEKVVGIDRNFFFNAGVLLINCRQFRAHNVLEQFTRLLGEYNFVVTQDEDYLNLICKDRVYWLDQRWNTEVFGNIPYPIEEACILHYIMTNKPWHYADCLYGDIFWKYAAQTSVYTDILTALELYTDEQRERDRLSCDNLLKLAVTETNREDNYQNRLNKTLRAADRVKILERITQKEALGLFDEDVEDDPPSPVLKPEDIDYINVHGTSTPLGDIAEIKAIEKLFGEEVYGVNISSTKSMTGHLLGATGALEALFSVKSVQEDIVPPTINHEEGDNDENIDYNLNFTFNTPQKRVVNAALSNSFGFGGHNATVIVKKYAE